MSAMLLQWLTSNAMHMQPPFNKPARTAAGFDEQWWQPLVASPAEGNATGKAGATRWPNVHSGVELFNKLIYMSA